MNLINLRGTYKNGEMHCKRLSDAIDVIPVRFAQDSVEAPKEDTRHYYHGTILTENNKMYVEVRGEKTTTDLGLKGLVDTTQCHIIGVITKIFPVRTTKKGKKLQDFLLCSHEQELKVVCFEPMPDFIKEGMCVEVNGRLQSREFYQKTTFEVQKKVIVEIALHDMKVLQDGQNQG